MPVCQLFQRYSGYLKFCPEIWVSLRMEILSSSIVFVLAMLAHTKVVGNNTQFVLALTYASALTYIMNLLLRSAANVEAEVRLSDYSFDSDFISPSLDELC
jgi:hypothetical protein